MLLPASMQLGCAEGHSQAEQEEADGEPCHGVPSRYVVPLK